LGRHLPLSRFLDAYDSAAQAASGLLATPVKLSVVSSADWPVTALLNDAKAEIAAIDGSSCYSHGTTGYSAAR